LAEINEGKVVKEKSNFEYNTHWFVAIKYFFYWKIYVYLFSWICTKKYTKMKNAHEDANA